MTREQFFTAHSRSVIFMGKFYEPNCLPSATDPTQDIPVGQINLGVDGEPLNVRRQSMDFANIPINQMTNIDRRNCDKFDILGEQMELQQSVRNTIKKSRKNEK